MNQPYQGIRVDERTSKKTGKTVYRIKKVGKRKCIWTDDAGRVEELQDVMARLS